MRDYILEEYLKKFYPYSITRQGRAGSVTPINGQPELLKTENVSQLFPTSCIDSIIARQSIVGDLLTNPEIFNYFREFYDFLSKIYKIKALKQSEDYLSRQIYSMSGSKSVSQDQIEEDKEKLYEKTKQIADLKKQTRLFPKPTKYCGNNKYISAWIKVLNEIYDNVNKMPSFDAAEKFHSISDILFRQIAPYVSGVQILNKLVRNGIPLIKAEFVNDGKISIYGAYPYFLEERKGNIKPLEITLDPRTYAGAIIVAPNGAGKSTLFNTLHQILYSVMICGYGPVKEKMKIGWLPDTILRPVINPIEYYGLDGSTHKEKGQFNTLVDTLYNMLNRKWGNEKPFVILDDLFEGATDFSTIEHLFRKLVELHKEEGLFVFSTIRNIQLANSLIKLGPFQEMGITDDHKVTQEFIVSPKGKEIIDKIHQMYVENRNYRRN